MHIAESAASQRCQILSSAGRVVLDIRSTTSAQQRLRLAPVAALHLHHPQVTTKGEMARGSRHPPDPDELRFARAEVVETMIPTMGMIRTTAMKVKKMRKKKKTRKVSSKTIPSSTKGMAINTHMQRQRRHFAPAVASCFLLTQAATSVQAVAQQNPW